MKKLIALTAIIFLSVTAQALALDLQSARSSGILGEKNDGYVSVLKSDAEAKALADKVNTARKAEYARISKENGQTLDVVAKVAAEEIAKKLPAGAKYQNASGAWVTR
jgi:uncharacterized protein YdbL (DUF1318 family)